MKNICSVSSSFICKNYEIVQETYFQHLLLHHADIANKRYELCNTSFQLRFTRLNFHPRDRCFLSLEFMIKALEVEN